MAKERPRRGVGVQRELGRMSAAIENADQARADLKATLEKVGDLITNLQGSVNGLAQTVQSMTTQLVALNAEKCGSRLDALEAWKLQIMPDQKTYDERQRDLDAAIAAGKDWNKTKAAAMKWIIIAAIGSMIGGVPGAITAIKAAFGI